MTGPAVSVIIPVFNRAHYLGDAIRSIVRQSFDDFEIIVVDDGSTDGSADVARSFADPRLRVASHDCNRGIPAARNTGLDQARGQFIAWLDSDDVARPHRLAEQVRFLRANPSIAMVGCSAGKIDQHGRRMAGIRVPPLSSADIGAWLLFRSAFQQSSVIGRAGVLKEYRYREEYPVCEDLDVFIRLAQSHSIRNLPRVLIDRRIHSGQTIRMEKDSIRDAELSLLAGSLTRLGVAFSSEDLQRHLMLGSGKSRSFRPDASYLDWAGPWMQRLKHANDRSLYVDQSGLRLAASFFWMMACRQAMPKLGAVQAVKRFLTTRHARGLISGHGPPYLMQALLLLLGIV